MKNKKSNTVCSVSKIASLLGVTLELAEYSIKRAGLTPVITLSGPRVNEADFAVHHDLMLDSPDYAEKMAMLNLRSLSARLVSPPELLILACSIGFPRPRLIDGVPSWHQSDIESLIKSCGADFIPVEELAKCASLSIAQLSEYVVIGVLPRILPLNFVPGWYRDDLVRFFEVYEVNRIREASEYDIADGRIFYLHGAPTPLRAVDKNALLHAFQGPIGHPIRLADGEFGWVVEHVNEYIYGCAEIDHSKEMLAPAIAGLFLPRTDSRQ